MLLTKKVLLYHITKSQRMSWLFWLSCLLNQVNFHQGYLVSFIYHIHDRSTDWQELQEWNLFHLGKPFFRSHGCYFQIFLQGNQCRFLFCFESFHSFMVLWSAKNVKGFYISPFSVLINDWFLFAREFFLVWNAYRATLPVRTLLSNLCFLP